MKQKQKYKGWDVIAIAIFGMVLIAWLMWSIFTYSHDEPKQIVFNITGITGPMNVSSLTQIHYECIKFCVQSTGTSNGPCWNQCASLGKEGCEK